MQGAAGTANTVTDPWNPPVGAPVQGATLLDGWTDSVGVSWDGRSLLFSYSRYDFGEFHNSSGLSWIVTGPARPGMTGDYFKMFKATLDASNWSIGYMPYNGNPGDHEFASLVLIGEANIAEFHQGWLMYMICGVAQSESGGQARDVQLKVCVARCSIIVRPRSCSASTLNHPDY